MRWSVRNTMRVSLSKLRRLGAGEAVPILAALLEMLWAYPWLVWAGSWDALRWARPPLSLASAVVVVVAAEALSRYALARNWPLARVRLVVLPVLALSLSLAVRLELGGGYALWDVRWTQLAAQHLSALVGGFLFGAYLLWRGMSVGRDSLSFDDLYPRFLVGLIGLVALLVVSSVAAWGDQPVRAVASAGPYVVAYFSVGLLALALANFQSISATITQQAEAPALFNRRWLSLAMAAVMGIVLVAVAVSSVFSFDLARLVLHPLNVLANWLLLALIYGIGVPLAVLVGGIVYVLRFLLQLMGRGPPPQPIQPPDLSELRKAAEGKEVPALLSGAIWVLKWGLVALVAVAVLWMLARALFRYRTARANEGIEEVHESLWSWETFKLDLRSLLAALVGRLRRRRATAPVLSVAPEAATDGPDTARLYSAREIYRALLWEGHQAGHPRSPWETPREYGHRLHDALRDGTDELGAITEAYAAERYGGMPAGGQRLEQINRLWRSLRSTLRGLPPAPHSLPPLRVRREGSKG